MTVASNLPFFEITWRESVFASVGDANDAKSASFVGLIAEHDW